MRAPAVPAAATPPCTVRLQWCEHAQLHVFCWEPVTASSLLRTEILTSNAFKCILSHADAALEGHVAVLRALLAAPGVSAGSMSAVGDTPLLFAASGGRLGAAALLAQVDAYVFLSGPFVFKIRVRVTDMAHHDGCSICMSHMPLQTPAYLC